MRNLIMRRGVEVAVVLLFVVGAYGDTVEVNLLDLGCPTNLSNWTSEFDMGVTFSQISNVYIDWSGQITAGLAVSNNNPNNPFPMDIGIIAYLGDNPWPRVVEIVGGHSTYPEAQSFNQISTFTLSQSNSWSDFFDGKGTVYLYRQGLYGSGMDWYYIYPGLIELNKATLIFEGTIIPEPATLFLLSFGVLGIRGARKKYLDVARCSNKI